MSRKQSGKPVRGNRKCDLERKRDERAARRALAKDRKNRPPEEEANEFFSFTNQLQALGLKLREVPGDGNCLFRALGDQLEGHSRGHLRLRQDTVQYMQAQRQDFEPFVEDDVPFTEHCTRVRGERTLGYKPLVINAVTVTFGLHNLSQPGTFAGNDAIVAFARSQQLRVVIHQLNTPLWEINGSDKPMCRELHIAYRYGDHYDSVRRIGDNSESPAHLYIENLNRCRGQSDTGHSGSGPGGQHNASSPPPPEDEEDLILSCLNMHGSSPPLTCPTQWLESDTPCPAQWQESAGKQVPDTAAEQGDDKSVRNASQKPKISNKQRKEQQRLEKKKRQEDRHRQKVLQSRSPQDQNLNSAEPITLVPALNTLII